MEQVLPFFLSSFSLTSDLDNFCLVVLTNKFIFLSK